MIAVSGGGGGGGGGGGNYQSSLKRSVLFELLRAPPANFFT